MTGITELSFDEFNADEIKAEHGIVDGSPCDEIPTNDDPTPAELDDSKDYIGLHQIPMADYRADESLSNGELQIFSKNPSAYIWNKTAPTDLDKATTADFGISLHTSLLEPELLDSTVLVSSIKGRIAESFKKEQRENKDRIVLTGGEYEQIKIMTGSARCDPTFKALLDATGTCESSIFVVDQDTGLKMKIRPDKIILQDGAKPIFVDIKSSANLEHWRNDRTFINPLFDMGYGFTAAYYLHVGSKHYNVELTHYYFAVVQKTSLLGRYPVSVFVITKDQLKELGFWQKMLDTIELFNKYKKSGDFLSFEEFPDFQIFDDESSDVTFTQE